MGALSVMGVYTLDNIKNWEGYHFFYVCHTCEHADNVISDPI
jgi:hypothetical protein